MRAEMFCDRNLRDLDAKNKELTNLNHFVHTHKFIVREIMKICKDFRSIVVATISLGEFLFKFDIVPIDIFALFVFLLSF